MSNVSYYTVNGQTRYVIQLSPAFKVEANSLAELLRFLANYGGNDVA